MPATDFLRPGLHSLAGGVISHRVLLYTLLSGIALSVIIGNALQTHSNFYSVTVYLSKSGRSVLVLANFALLVALFFGRVVQQIFFGSLRAVEVERLYDRMWFFVTESLLAFTIFRDEFDIPFAVMFGFLLFVKSFHWLMADRIEWMNQMPYPGPPLLFHIRINSLFFLLWLTNLVMFAFAVESILTNGVGAIVLFASEYAILMASAMNSMAKYTLAAYEFRRAASRGGENAPPWENKSIWTFYVDLTTDFLKLITYLAFFTIIITFYGVPLNVVRDVYITARSFITRLRDLLRYRSATRNMDQRYPNATEEEMTAMSDRTCIICREEMILPATPGSAEHVAGAPTPPAPPQDGPNTTPKKLPCGHIFHFHCLRSWLERQQSCPTCRRPVLTSPPAGRQEAGGAARGPQPPAAAGNRPGPPGQHAQALNYLRGLFGVAQPQQPPPPPPYAAGQLPPPQFPQNFAWGPAPVPQGFGYPPAPQAPQHLAPPPVYQGFIGPGGVWHPWVDQRYANPPPQQANQPGSASSGGSTATSPQAPVVPVSPPSTPGDGPTISAPTPTPVSTPRDAAALAALRRSGSSSSNPQSSTMPGASRSTPGTTPTPTVNGTGPSPTPANTPSEASSAPSSGPPPVAPPYGPAERHELPPLIPVSDYSSVMRNLPYPIPGFNGSPPVYRGQDPSGARPPQPPGQWPPQPQQPAGMGQRASSSASALRPTTPAHYPFRGDPRFQGRGGAAPSVRLQLPPTLTDEQLARLDRLTRDSIDERLRVLEGVSITVSRCIDELTRVRSVLPASSTPPAQGPIFGQSPMPGAGPSAHQARPSSNGLSAGPARPEMPKSGSSSSFHEAVQQLSAGSSSSGSQQAAESTAPFGLTQGLGDAQAPPSAEPASDGGSSSADSSADPEGEVVDV